MTVHLYTGSLGLVRRSGVGQAVAHQRRMLEANGVTVVTTWQKADAVHINTVLPDAPFAALLARPARRARCLLRPFDRAGFPQFFCRLERVGPAVRPLAAVLLQPRRYCADPDALREIHPGYLWSARAGAGALKWGGYRFLCAEPGCRRSLPRAVRPCCRCQGRRIGRALYGAQGDS